MRVRAEQMIAVQAAMVAQFEERLVGHAQSVVPGVADQADLRDLVRHAVGRAKDEVARFVVAILRWGVDPDELERKDWPKELLEAKLRRGVKLNRRPPVMAMERASASILPGGRIANPQTRFRLQNPQRDRWEGR